MKTLLTLLLLAASAFGQTATISDTIRTPFGGTFSGTVTVSLNSPALAQPLYSGSVTLSGWTQAVTVTAGVFTLTLYTNDLITPGGTSYTATYAPTSGSGWKETWIVPSGATTIREIRSTTVPSPSVRFTPSQITQAGATLGQGLRWNGSIWAPASVIADPMTTNGDLITRLSGVPVRVGIGSTNQVLTVSGGMPVWVSGITGNASTATALAANGTNCSAGSFALGVDASGNAEGCTAAVTASTGLSDSADIVRGGAALTTTGSVPFVTSAGALGQSANLFWDNANGRLGVGTNAPQRPAHIRNAGGLRIDTASSGFDLTNTNTGEWQITAVNSISRFGILGSLWTHSATGNVALGTTTDLGYGLHAANKGTNGNLLVFDPTGTTGTTKAVFVAGQGQSGNILEVRGYNATPGSGTLLASIDSIGRYTIFGGGASLTLVGNNGYGSPTITTTGGNLAMPLFGFSWAGALDLSLSRASANTLQVGDGGANSNGDLAYREWRGTARTFANLGTPADGTFVYCSNCTVANPCASGGTGALARRLNAAWVCSDGGGGGGSGTVTSVSVSTGLLSVANPTTAPDISIAGTSGGVPYFSNSTTLASSAALDAGALVVGGGAGGAPTILANSSVPNAGELRISTTPTPGATRSVFTLGSAITGGGAGANAGTFYALNAPSGFVGDFMRFELNGAAAFAVNRLGTITVGTANTFGSAGVSVSNVGTLAFANTSSGASAASRITGSAGTGSGNFLALRPTSASSGPDVLRVNADQRGVMIGQTAETASVSNLSLGVFDDTASTGVTRHLIQKAANQGTVSPFEVRDFNATLGDGALLFEIEPDGSFRSLPTGTRPTCASGIRGTYWYTQGGTGVKDAVEVCAKDAADAYAWRTIY